MQQQLLEGKVLRNVKTNQGYLIRRLIGSGSFSHCYEAMSEDKGELIAIKVVKTDSIRQRYRVLMEIKIHKQLHHPNIVGFHDAFQNEKTLYIFLEYGGNSTLKQFLNKKGKLLQLEVKIITRQIIQAVQYIHQKSIIHRDLKPTNILLNDKMQAKLCDFGLSTRVESEGRLKKTFCGTPNYMAPQIVSKRNYSYEVDIWSIGAIMYQLLSGIPPFEGSSVQETYENILNFTLNIPQSLSKKAIDLLTLILNPNPKKRPTLIQILNHEFMNIDGQIPPCPQQVQISPLKMLKKLSVASLQGMEKRSLLSSSELLVESLEKINQNAQIPYIYIKQSYFTGQILGFLLSNGVVGIYCKNGLNLLIQYGTKQYTIIMKNHSMKSSITSSKKFSSNAVQEVYLEYLSHFLAFFTKKYGEAHLQQMKQYWSKFSQKEIEVVYVKKCLKIEKKQFVTRLNNNATQLHFRDGSSVCLQVNSIGDIFFISQMGQSTMINYLKCEDDQMKTKIRKIYNVIQKLSKRKNQ